MSRRCAVVSGLGLTGVEEEGAVVLVVREQRSESGPSEEMVHKVGGVVVCEWLGIADEQTTIVDGGVFEATGEELDIWLFVVGVPVGGGGGGDEGR